MGLEAVIRPLGGAVEVRDGLVQAAVGGRAVLFVAVEHVGGGHDAAENLRGAVESRIGMARGLVRRAIGGGGAVRWPAGSAPRRRSRARTDRTALAAAGR